MLSAIFDSSSKFQSSFAKVATTGKGRNVSGSYLANKGPAVLSNKISADLSWAHPLLVPAAGSRPRRVNLQETPPSSCPCHHPPSRFGGCKTCGSARQCHTAKTDGLLSVHFVLRMTHLYSWHSNACKRVQALEKAQLGKSHDSTRPASHNTNRNAQLSHAAPWS